MLQSLTTMLFAATLIGGLALVALFIRQDWVAVRSALGLLSPVAPLPVFVRAQQARRAAIVQVELTAWRRAA